MDWKDKLSFTYSTNPDFKPDRDEENEKHEAIPPSKQRLIVGIERKK